MRCLVLADLLREEGSDVTFVCRPGKLNTHIENRGFPVKVLDGSCMQSQEEDARLTAKWLKDMSVDWLVVDHYELDTVWERILACYAEKIMAIDDLANRPHQCDLLLDQFDPGNGSFRYRGLVPEYCRLLLGLDYFLLHPSFIRAKKSISIRSGDVRQLLIFYGGSDPTGETEKVLAALRSMDCSWKVDVVIGQANPRMPQIRQLCDKSRFSLFVQTSEIARLMARADLAFGAGGVSMWERCFLGLPSVVTTVAANQNMSVAHAAKFGAVWSLGWHGEMTSSVYRQALEEALTNKERLSKMSERSLQLTSSVWNGVGRHPVVSEMIRLYEVNS